MKELVIETTLDDKFLERDDLKEFLGKEVKIVVTQSDDISESRQKLLELGGTQNWGGKLDEVNLRDWAYD